MEAIEAKGGHCLRPQSDKVVELSLDCPQQRVVAEELSHRGHEHLHVRAVPTMHAGSVGTATEPVMLPRRDAECAASTADVGRP